MTIAETIIEKYNYNGIFYLTSCFLNLEGYVKKDNSIIDNFRYWFSDGSSLWFSFRRSRDRKEKDRVVISYNDKVLNTLYEHF